MESYSKRSGKYTVFFWEDGSKEEVRLAGPRLPPHCCRRCSAKRAQARRVVTHGQVVLQSPVPPRPSP